MDGLKRENKRICNRGALRPVTLFLILPLLLALGVLAARGAFPVRYENEVSAAAREFGLQEGEVYAVIWTESKFKPNAVSRAGAMGLMQLMPSTALLCAKSLGLNDADVFIPEQNVRMGCFYLRYLKEKFDGDYAYAAYNAGESNVALWLSKDGRIAFTETEQYVARVRLAKTVYRMLYGLKS